MVDVFAITGTVDDLPARIEKKYSGRADRIFFYNLFGTPLADEGRQRELIKAVSS
jgi:hypothetical protein